MRYIFDLDHTLICSKHRSLTLADGSLDLAAWRENCTREKIFADSLLPLAQYAKMLIRAKREVIACTARVMTQHDFDYLRENGFHFTRILSRPAGCEFGDATLKETLLAIDALDCGVSWKEYTENSLMFEDNQEVLRMARNNGIIAFDANKLNKVA